MALCAALLAVWAASPRPPVGGPGDPSATGSSAAGPSATGSSAAAGGDGRADDVAAGRGRLLGLVTLSGAPTPAAPAPKAPARGRLVISGAGDTNLDPSYIPAFRTQGYAYAFTGLQDVFHRDDLTVVNLECASSTLGSPRAKTFTFNCDPAALPVMRAAGVEAANLANNHSGDYGPAALLDTRANVLRAGLAPLGVGRNAAEAATPARFELKGWRVAVLGFGGVVPDPSWIASADRAGMADGDTTAAMVATVRAAKADADLVVVAIHWGVELDTTPRPDDVARARALVEAGADVIFGGHSHRLNPLDTVAGRPVAWSLGNFVWPRMSPAGSTTAIAQVIVEPDGTIRSCLIPVAIEASGHPVVQVAYQGNCIW